MRRPPAVVPVSYRITRTTRQRVRRLAHSLGLKIERLVDSLLVEAMDARARRASSGEDDREVRP